MPDATASIRILSANDILSVRDVKMELVEVPEWDGAVWVRGMTGEERDAYEMANIDPLDQTKVCILHIRARLATHVICEPGTGRLYFSSDDIPKLTKLSALSLQRIFVVGQRLSGMDDSFLNATKKRVDSDPFSDSLSDSL